MSVLIFVYLFWTIFHQHIYMFRLANSQHPSQTAYRHFSNLMHNIRPVLMDASTLVLFISPTTT